MKAKEIINLCENEQLDSTQIFNLIYDYFVKKMKLVGVVFVDNGFDIEVQLSSAMVSDGAKAKRISRAYIKDMASKFDGGLYLNVVGGMLNIRHPNPVCAEWKEYSIFYASTSTRYSNRHPSSCYIILSIVFSNPNKNFTMTDFLNKYTEFSTETGRKEIYNLIDSIAKFIRLTPLGE